MPNCNTAQTSDSGNERSPVCCVIAVCSFAFAMLLAVVWLGSTLSADESNPETSASPSQMAHSAQVTEPREVAAAIDRIHEHTRRGRHGLAVGALAELARSHPAQLVLISSGNGTEQYEAVPFVVRRLLSNLPESAQRLYELQMEDRAESQLREALVEKKIDDVLSVALCFPGTDASRTALRHLISRHMDASEWRSAIGAIRQLQADPATSRASQARLNEQLAFCLSAIKPLENQQELPATFDRSDTSDSKTSARDIALLANVVPQFESPFWNVNFHDTPEWRATVPPAILEHAEQSIPVLPRARPVVHGNQLLVRSSTGIMALDRTTGARVWQQSATSGTQFGAERAPYVPSLRGLLAQSLAREIQLDSVHSQLVTFGELVCYAEAGSDGLTNSARTPNSQPFDSRLPIAAANQLVAREIKTGKPAWLVTGQTLGNDIKQENQTAFFLGVPTVVDDQLFGVAQINDDVLLYVLDVAGELQWKCKLATTSRKGPVELDWRSFACPVSVTDGVAVCATNAGVVVAVDLLSRNVRWAFRYERDDARISGDALQQTNRPNRESFQGWREARLIPYSIEPRTHVDANQLLAAEQVDEVRQAVLFAGPDQNGLVSLDVSTGRLIWSRPVESPSPIELIDVQDDSVFVLARHHVESINATSGKKQWQIDAPEPAGRGVVLRQSAVGKADDQRFVYVYPTVDTRIALVDLTNPRVLRSVPGLSPAVNLTIADGQLIAHSLDQVTAWPTLQQSFSNPHSRNTETANDALDIAQELQLAQMFGSLGVIDESEFRFTELTKRLNQAKRTGQLEIDRLKLLEQVTTERLRLWDRWQFDPTVSVAMLTTARDFLDSPSTAGVTIRQKVDAWLALARAANSQKQFAFAMDAYLAALKLNPEGDVVIHASGPTRRVLIERLIQGELLQLIDQMDPASHNELSNHFSRTVLDQATKNQDPFAKQRAAQRMRMIAWARPLQFLDETRIGLLFYRQQLDLLALEKLPIATFEAGVVGQNLAARKWASQQLADLFSSRAYEKDAAPWQWKLQQPPLGPKIEALPSGKLPTKPELLKTLSESEWSAEPPTVDTSGQPTRTPMQLVEIEAQPGSPFSRLSAFVSEPQRTGQTLVFCGDGHAGHWRLTLPHSEAPFRQVVRPKAWGIGQFFVLRLGADLFGITPFAPNGDPQPRLIWSQSMDAGAVIGGVRLDAGTPGVRSPEIEFLDSFARPVGQVGPVLPGHLCYQSKGKLCCIETATGKLLWDRYELPRESRLSGDSDFVFLVTSENAGCRVCVLRAADGSTVRDYSVDVPMSDDGSMIWMQDSRLFVASNVSKSSSKFGSVADVVPRQLQAFWLADGKPLWERDLDAAARVFAIDEDFLGLASKSAGLQVLDVSTGEVRMRCDVELPEKIATVFAINDYSQTYFVYSRTSRQDANLPPNLLGFRNEFVDGGIVAVNRWSLEQKWHKLLTNEQVNWTQPNGVPFLVLAFQDHAQANESEKTRTVFHLIDKRSGATLHRETKPVSDERFVIEPNAPQNWIRLQTTIRSIQVNYPPPG